MLLPLLPLILAIAGQHVLVQGQDSPNCTVSGSDGVSILRSAKANCSAIVISSLTVPAGVTLDLKNLNNGTTVRPADVGVAVMAIIAAAMIVSTLLLPLSFSLPLSLSLLHSFSPSAPPLSLYYLSLSLPNPANQCPLSR